MDPDRTKKETEDESLYNAMIWALSIGIIIVIATLFLTKPPEESFTELYFNNHQNLPEYVELGKQYNYSFTISNLENKDTQYNYTLTADLYSLDYGCENPQLYLEQYNASKYEQSKETIPTRRAYSKEPSLLITEPEYGISVNYEIKSGQGQIVLGLMSIYDKPKYAVIISQKDSKVYLIAGNSTAYSATIPQKGRIHLRLTPENILLTLNNQDVISAKAPEDYTRGYPFLETTSTYALLTGTYIERGKEKEAVTIEYADAQYKTETLRQEEKPGIMIVYPKFLATANTAIYNKIYHQPTINVEEISRPSVEYYVNNSINLTSYTLKVSFTGQVTTGFEDQLTARYSRNERIIEITSNGSSQNFTIIPKTPEVLTIDIDNNIARVSLNGKVLMENIVLTPGQRPFLKAIGSPTIEEFSVKSSTEPYVITYDLNLKKSVKYASLRGEDFINTIKQAIYNNESTNMNTTTTSTTLADEQELMLQKYYETERLLWPNYRFTATYKSAGNSTLKLSMQGIADTIYSINITDTKIIFSYIKNDTQINATINVTAKATNRIVFDVLDNNAVLIYNDKTVLRDSLDRASGGLLLFDYDNINLTSAQVADKNSKMVRIYRRPLAEECAPILINSASYTSTEYIKDNERKIFNAHAIFNEGFDIAKVQVSLGNGQEIHYWVKQI